MGNIFFERSYTKYDRETISRPLSKKSGLSISLDQSSKCLYSLLLLYAKFIAIKILKQSCRLLAFTSCKDILKNKESSGTSFPASFPA